MSTASVSIMVPGVFLIKEKVTSLAEWPIIRKCSVTLLYSSANDAMLTLTFLASLIAQLVRNPPARQETPVLFLGWEDPLEKGMAAHSSILAWRIPWTI